MESLWSFFDSPCHVLPHLGPESLEENLKGKIQLKRGIPITLLPPGWPGLCWLLEMEG